MLRGVCLMLKTSYPRKSMILQLGLLAVLVWGVYANSLHNPFHFDDFHVISDNPAVRGISDIPSFFVDPTTFSILPGNRDYRPVFLTSMALSWWSGGGSTLPFHLVSVTIHMGNVFLLFFIFRWFFFIEGGPGKSFSRSQKEWAVTAGAGIFALHPLATEPVNYISSQSVLLAAFFYLLSFHLFLTIHGGDVSHPKVGLWVRRIGSYTAYFLGLLSKPIAITLPLNLLLWEWLLGRDQGDQAAPISSLGRLWRRMRKHLPYFGLTLLYLLIRQSLLPKAFSTPARSIVSHYLTQTKALVLYYLKHALIPLGLNVDPQFPVSHSLIETNVLFSIFVLAGIGFLVLKMRRQRVLVFWALWFPICLLVTTYLTILGQIVSDHRVYLSIAGVSALAGLFLAWLRTVFPYRISDLSLGPKSGKALVTVLLLAIWGSLALITIGRNQVWASDLALWEDAALNRGTWRAHMNYGLALDSVGRSDEAFQQFKKAVELFPGAYSHINLGLAYLKRGSLEQGLDHFRKAVELWPDLPEAHLYLAYGLEKNGKIQDAEKEYLQAIRLRPNYLKGYRWLAQFYERLRKPQKAHAAYQKLFELDRSQSWVQERMNRLTAQTGRERVSQFDRGLQKIAAGEYSEAVKILTDAYPRYPKDRDLLFNLAFSHQKLGNRTEAIRYYEELLQVTPMHVKGNFNLAYAYLHGTSTGDFSRSSLLFKKVLKLDPGYSEALFHLATAYWKLGNETEARRYDQLYLKQGVHEDLKRRSQSRLSERR